MAILKFAAFSKITNKAGYIVLFFFSKIRKDVQYLSLSAAVMIGALRVRKLQRYRKQEIFYN